MSRAVVPIANLSRRLPELGRIRTGVKSGRAMKAIDTFRFTSHDETALGQVADIYGGSVKPWSDPKAAPGQFEVITTATELRVVLPLDPLGGSPVYELWGGGGCDRRCDGVTCTRMVKGPDGPEPVDVPCMCVASGAMACEPHTRLSVILPEVRFGGVWRLDTKSWNAAQELPAMVDLLASMQERGLTTGVLRLEQRRSVTAGQTRHYVVPVLGLLDSMDALAAGAARFGAGEIPSSSAPALTSGEVVDAPPVAPSTSSDDDVVDAELVEEASLADFLPADVPDAKALVVARRVASEYGATEPTALEQVTDPRFIARVLDELGVEAVA